MEILLPFIIPVIIITLASIKQVNEYERGLIYSMGKFTGIIGPGWHVVWPIIQSFRKVDIRTKAVDVPKQETITKDNVSCKMNAVIYFKISDASKAVNEVENVFWAVSQLAQTTMRRVAGEATLDELLSNREKIAKEILKSVDTTTDQWGIDVETVELKDIELPENMVRTMAKQAEAEREKRATIINSEGEVLAAQNLSQAATMMAATPGALHLRTLNSINDISSDQSNTVIFALPMEILRAIEGIGNMVRPTKKK
jgi:regulator of protease activity HflC (stomatin/prohibitin superfamily)